MKYLEQYLQFLSVMQQVDGIEIDSTYEDAKFKDPKVAFGYVIYHLEKSRVEKMHEKMAEEFDRQFEEMYQLGKEAGVLECMKRRGYDF